MHFISARWVYRLIGVAFNDSENKNINNGPKETIVEVIDMNVFKL